MLILVDFENLEQYGLPLIDILKMHGECWHEYADWIARRIRFRIEQYGKSITKTVDMKEPKADDEKPS